MPAIVRTFGIRSCVHTSIAFQYRHHASRGAGAFLREIFSCRPGCVTFLWVLDATAPAERTAASASIAWTIPPAAMPSRIMRSKLKIDGPTTTGDPAIAGSTTFANRKDQMNRPSLSWKPTRSKSSFLPYCRPQRSECQREGLPPLRVSSAESF